MTISLRQIKDKLLDLFNDKQRTELRFQKQWHEFSWEDILVKLKDYWYSYRYLDEIEKYVEFNETKRILDVGCGITSVLNIIQGDKYGIDPLIEEYKKLYPLDKSIMWMVGYGEDIPFDDSFFDIVFCSNVLDHSDNPPIVISEIKRVIKNNGKLVLTVDIFRDKKKRDKAHPHSLTEKDVDDLLVSDFQILFKKLSPINAQIYNFMKGKITKIDYREIVVVGETQIE